MPVQPHLYSNTNPWPPSHPAHVYDPPTQKQALPIPRPQPIEPPLSYLSPPTGPVRKSHFPPLQLRATDVTARNGISVATEHRAHPPSQYFLPPTQRQHYALNPSPGAPSLRNTPLSYHPQPIDGINRSPQTSLSNPHTHTMSSPILHRLIILNQSVTSTDSSRNPRFIRHITRQHDKMSLHPPQSVVTETKRKNRAMENWIKGYQSALQNLFLQHTARRKLERNQKTPVWIQVRT